jgi:hypothetical protein
VRGSQEVLRCGKIKGRPGSLRKAFGPEGGRRVSFCPSFDMPITLQEFAQVASAMRLSFT